MYNADNDVSRIFLTDSREKKRVGVGIHARASRRGYCKGGIKFQSDFLTAKQIKNLSGVVKVTSVFDKYKDLENCDLDEILKKGTKDIGKILTIIKANNSCNPICRKFKISNGKLYSIYAKYGVIYGKKTQVKKDEVSLDKLESTVISKEKFNLMDTYSKGKYINSLDIDYSIGCIELSKFWGIPNNTLHYCKNRYLKKANLTETNIDSKKEDILNLVDTVEETETSTTEVANKEEELLRRIAELEETNKKLIDTLASNTNSEASRLSLNIKGEYLKDELSDRLLSIDNITIPDIKYSLILRLEEI